MMIPHVCRSLISLSLKNSSHLHKPPVFFSFSLLFFSSSRPKNSNSADALSEVLVNRHEVSPNTALKASASEAFLENPEITDPVLSYLNENGFSKSHIEKIIRKYPRILTANLGTIKPKIEFFQELGFSHTDTAYIISSDPWILGRSVDNQLEPSISVLQSLLGSISRVSMLLKRCGCFLKFNLEKTMLPNIEFLRSCGISSEQIAKYMFFFPRFFLQKPENIMKFVRRVYGMGFDRKSTRFLHAIVVISSMSPESWELKLKLFLDLGFTEDDILSVFRRVPQVFSISERKIKEATGILLGRRNLDISFIVDHADLLIFSVERRLKPRLEVFDILESKNLLPRKLSLSTICKISHDSFVSKYVLPYSDELGEVSMARRALGL